MRLKCEICGKTVDQSERPPVEIPSQKTCLCSYECCEKATINYLRSIGRDDLITWVSIADEAEPEVQLTLAGII